MASVQAFCCDNNDDMVSERCNDTVNVLMRLAIEAVSKRSKSAQLQEAVYPKLIWSGNAHGNGSCSGHLCSRVLLPLAV